MYILGPQTKTIWMLLVLLMDVSPSRISYTIKQCLNQSHVKSSWKKRGPYRQVQELSMDDLENCCLYLLYIERLQKFGVHIIYYTFETPIMGFSKSFVLLIVKRALWKFVISFSSSSIHSPSSLTNLEMIFLLLRDGKQVVL